MDLKQQYLSTVSSLSAGLQAGPVPVASGVQCGPHRLHRAQSVGSHVLPAHNEPGVKQKK